jgi:hypothetical protein
MEKAYDLPSLVSAIKAQGIEVTEELAKSITIAVIAWLDESASVSPTPYDDMLKVLYPVIKEKLLALEEKINPNG